MKKILIALFVVVVITGFFVVSCPDKNAHVSALKQAFMEDKTNNPHDKWEALGNALASSVAESIIENSVTVKNHFVFSKGVYEGNRVSLGLLGHVYTSKNLSFKYTEKEDPVVTEKVIEKPEEATFYYSDGTVMSVYGEGHQNDHIFVSEVIRRHMLAKEPQQNQYPFVGNYNRAIERWKNDPLYGWCEKNPSPDGQKIDFIINTGGLKIYTTINPRMQSYAEDAIIKRLSIMQDAFDKERANWRNSPYIEETDDSVIEREMNQSRRWSDRMRIMKQHGASQEEIIAAFNQPTKMKIYSWGNGAVIDTVMTPNDSILYYKSLAHGSLIAMNPHTGAIEAYVGNEYGLTFDFAQQIQSPIGSTVQPFIYATALESGMSPCSAVKNEVQSFDVGGRSWSPLSNDPESVQGSNVTLKWGLAHSSNNISAYLVKKATPEVEKAQISRFHIDLGDPTPAISVGVSDVALLDLTSGFNVFANQGQYVQPVFVTKITDSKGHVLYENKTAFEFTITEQNAYYMVDMLKAVADNGTAMPLREKYGFEGEVACKTGLSYDMSNSWFVGSVPNLTVGVWTGWESLYTHFTNPVNAQVSATTMPIWANFIMKCQEDNKIKVSKSDKFKVPDNVESITCTGGDEDVR